MQNVILGIPSVTSFKTYILHITSEDKLVVLYIALSYNVLFINFNKYRHISKNILIFMHRRVSNIITQGDSFIINKALEYNYTICPPKDST